MTNFENMNILNHYGFKKEHFEETQKLFGNTSLQPARVLSRNRNIYQLITESGPITGSLSGKYQYENETSQYPVVGDWVVVEMKDQMAVIQGMLSRKGKFSRKEAGQVTNEQVLAANVDLIFIVTGLDSNFNLSRIQRYRTVVLEGGAQPVLILNKADLCDDLEEKLEAVRKIAPEDPLHAVSTWTGEGIEVLYNYLTEGTTIAFFGSSGVGKSSLTNALMRESHMATSAVSAAHGKGRHTTTTAELILLPSGGCMIDTPGIREIQIWCHEDAVETGFEDIAALAATCQFDDCKHRAEPGCAVKKALKTGVLSQKHYDNYQNMKKEAIFIEAKQRHKDRLSNKPEKKQKPRQKKFSAYLDV